MAKPRSYLAFAGSKKHESCHVLQNALQILQGFGNAAL
jgi:hypothetical protein